VARASLEELRLDYEDFLRQRGLPLWDRNDPRRADLIARRPATADDVAAWVKEACGRDGQHGLDGQKALSTMSTSSTTSDYTETAANAAFEQEGGFTERLYQRRREAKGFK
jgi:hypothetical protein